MDGHVYSSLQLHLEKNPGKGDFKADNVSKVLSFVFV